MLITLDDQGVIKTFKDTRGRKKRYRTEKAALALLRDIPGIPALLEQNDENFSLKMSFLPGNTPIALHPEEFTGIKNIISAALQRGVARHSLPIRDILSTRDGKVGIVDFERVTIKKTYDPLNWFIAKRVTLFHLNRLIFEHQPQLLNETEALSVSLGFKIRKFFRKYMLLRDLFRNS